MSDEPATHPGPTDPGPPGGEGRVIEHGELVDGSSLPDSDGDTGDEEPTESIEQPAKVMRVGAMMRQLLEELREASLDEPSRDRLRSIYETSIAELSSAVSPDLRDELDRLTLPFAGDETPSEAELRVAEAQLVGWLEGLVQGIQATLFAQQMAAQQQLANMRQQLPAGPQGRPGAPPGQGPQTPTDGRHGTYL
ncbi:MAG: DUF2587 domain-containing protein [Acidimicrobiales bacterium]